MKTNIKNVEVPRQEFDAIVREAGSSESDFEVDQAFCHYPPADQGVGPVTTVITVCNLNTGVKRRYSLPNGQRWVKWLDDFKRDLRAGTFKQPSSQ